MSLKKIDFHNGCPYQTDDGLFYNVADVEPILNSLQQLKIEIAAIATSFNQLGPGSCDGEQLKAFYELVIKLRQLSAV
jgi:hypothetical protein